MEQPWNKTMETVRSSVFGSLSHYPRDGDTEEEFPAEGSAWSGGVTLTHGPLWLSNTRGLMGNTTDNQKHLAIKANNTNTYKQTWRTLLQKGKKKTFKD